MKNVLDMFRLDGRVAFVTGGARNLGRDMATALAQAGADVVVTSRKAEAAQATATLIASETGRQTLGLGLDVRQESEVIAAVDAALARFGRIDILVNNAGNVVSTPENKPLEVRPTDEWDETISVNLRGAFLCSKHVVAKAMKPQQSGVIINMSSVAGVVGRDHRIYENTGMGGTTVDYAASKGGIIALTREMACWLAQYNIRVNCMSPAAFWRGHNEYFTRQYSAQVPMGRLGIDGQDLNGVVVFLALDASGYITGVNLSVDGGMTAW